MTEKQETRARRRRRSAAEVEQVAAEFASSGMGRQEFCRSRGLGLSTLHRYLKKHEKQHKTKMAKSRLVPVEVVKAPQKLGEGSSGLLLVAASGHKIEVRRDFDEATLRQLLNVLEQR